MTNNVTGQFMDGKRVVINGVVFVKEELTEQNRKCCADECSCKSFHVLKKLIGILLANHKEMNNTEVWRDLMEAYVDLMKGIDNIKLDD